MRHVQLILIASLLHSLPVAGQVLPSANGLLIIETNSLEAVVMIGDDALGLASEGPFLVPVGPTQLTLVEAISDAWSPRRSTADVTIRPGETTTLRLDLPVRHRIDSLPPGAEVVLRNGGQDEVLGIAPVIVDRHEPMDGTLVARRTGFRPAELAPGDSSFNHYTFVLQPLEAGTALDGATSWVPPTQPKRWIDYAAAGVALAATSLAIYFKFEADGVDDRYRNPDSLERGNPLLKQEAERLDLYSLGALGVMQAGITVLAVRFILR